MNLIKLNAIDSTNSFLKELSRDKVLENITVVTTKNQLKGRGQMNSVWESESGKNLTFSVFVKPVSLDLKDQFYLSKAIAVALLLALNSEIESKISVKWPNDILAEGCKIAGILIENNAKKAKISESVIGIGLNVNQIEFNNLSKVSSLKKLAGKEFDLDELLVKIIDSIKFYIELLNHKRFKTLDEIYFKYLYKMGVPSMFRNAKGELFMAKILTVTKSGLLEMELPDESIRKFDLKELSFIL